MTLDELLDRVDLNNTPIKLCRSNATATATVSELIGYFAFAYQAGREQTESELAMLIASNPLELDPPQPAR